jgi:hypothetical protein
MSMENCPYDACKSKGRSEAKNGMVSLVLIRFFLGSWECGPDGRQPFMSVHDETRDHQPQMTDQNMNWDAVQKGTTGFLARHTHTMDVSPEG